MRGCVIAVLGLTLALTARSAEVDEEIDQPERPSSQAVAQDESNAPIETDPAPERPLQLESEAIDDSEATPKSTPQAEAPAPKQAGRPSTSRASRRPQPNRATPNPNRTQPTPNSERQRPERNSGTSSRPQTPRRSNRPNSRDRERPDTTLLPTGFAKFRIITDRNIFNGQRSPRSSRESREERAAARAETFTLVGTMSYDKGPYAFFDGTSANFKKVLETGGKIAGYTIAAITANSVKLNHDTNTVELEVGMQMRRHEDGWRPSESTRPARDSERSVSSESGSGSAEDDIVKRLMEQRAKELE